MTFNNPLKRCLEKSDDDDGKCFGIESARLIINHIFDEIKKENPREMSNIEQRILMQAVPQVLLQ